ncbi:MAG: hypothetical protein QNJ41_25455 [Xenococcaceae cyanobacterium MO_188.B32]|nr:hypothetical protein [Xenococcaceae cyanobacterium MO_188.B32]
MPDAIEKDLIDRPQSKQNRLNSKLKERLGYTGIYSQRNSQQFFENLSSGEREELLQELKAMYCKIFTDYFTEENQTNQRIDRFVEQAFFINLPIGKVVEIHIDLVDELSRQLKLEGRNPEYLCDYRLTLIDVIAHLGEMYRRSLKSVVVSSESE